MSNFKSLVDFDMPLGKFTCLVGLNGAGKSTVLQFVDFLSQLVRGRMDTWLEDRGWAADELRSQLCDGQLISFDVKLSGNSGVEQWHWSGRFDPATLKCTTEAISTPQDGRLSVRPGGGSSSNWGDNIVNALPKLSYQGSMLSVIDEMSDQMRALKSFFANMHSLELLAPELMRGPSYKSAGTVGGRGEALAAYMHQLTGQQRHRIVDRLRSAYHRLASVQPKSFDDGRKQLTFGEQYDGRSLLTDARHVNDGMLRLLAVIAELESDHSLLVFDEIENGVNTELARFLIDALLESPQQVLVTTHSPVVLNYLPDDVARDAMVYLYKLPDGRTQAVRLFDIPRMAKKLELMGPGEAFGDTDLYRLNDELLTEDAADHAVPAER